MTGSTFLPAAGDPLHDAVGLVRALGRVEDHQLAHAAPVVAGDDADDLGRMAGDRPGVEDRVGPVGVAAVVLPLARAVGIHAEQARGSRRAAMSVYSQRR